MSNNQLQINTHIYNTMYLGWKIEVVSLFNGRGWNMTPQYLLIQSTVIVF